MTQAVCIGPGPIPEPVNVVFVVNKVTSEQDTLRILRLTPVSIALGVLCVYILFL
jgi:hypothetical protein